MPLQSWTKRQSQRGAGMVVFRPPAPHDTQVGWHLIDMHLGRQPMEFRPGIDVWFDSDRQRWTGEFAGSHKWTYVEPCGDPLYTATDARARARAAAGNAGRGEDRGAGKRTAAADGLRRPEKTEGAREGFAGDHSSDARVAARTGKSSLILAWGIARSLGGV